MYPVRKHAQANRMRYCSLGNFRDLLSGNSIHLEQFCPTTWLYTSCYPLQAIFLRFLAVHHAHVVVHSCSRIHASGSLLY